MLCVGYQVEVKFIVKYLINYVVFTTGQSKFLKIKDLIRNRHNNPFNVLS